jgi:hypothetical protein
MFKKVLSLILSVGLTMSLVACGSKEEAPKETNSPPAKQEEPKKAETKNSGEKIPSGLGTEMGKGKFSVATPSGTSENGQVPVLFVGKDTSIDQVGVNAFEFDGSKLSYLYVDGILNTKEQLADTQTSVNIKGDAIKVGTHKVEVVQFENDKSDGKAITYKVASYEVKEK